MNTFFWLLKREYWENRGGFLWVPAITACVMLALTLMGMLVGELTARRAGVVINNIRIGELTAQIGPEQLAQVGAGIDVTLFGLSMMIAVVLAFVLFFYLLGALYDDRRDRSILFWKSLPISDTATVLSKAVAAMLVAPVLAVGATLALMLGFMILISLHIAFHGVNPITTIWMTASPLAIGLKMLALIPLNALWALPSIGWLLLCSAFAKRAPFLWATLVPIGAGGLVSWFDLMQGFHLPHFAFWKHVVGRVLLSIAPGSWMGWEQLQHLRVLGLADLPDALGFSTIGATLARADLWIGAAAGATMIAAAIWLRRWRDDN